MPGTFLQATQLEDAPAAFVFSRAASARLTLSTITASLSLPSVALPGWRNYVSRPAWSRSAS